MTKLRGLLKKKKTAQREVIIFNLQVIIVVTKVEQ